MVPAGGPGMTMPNPVVVVVMGVAGVGKTTVAKLLAEALHCHFLEGDELHPPANVAKMRGGTPLSDADRLPWLQRIAEAIDAWRLDGRSGVVTCSALKRRYRDILIGSRPDVRLVYLEGSRELVRSRLASRKAHFMPAALLDSQFDDLEAPGADEKPIVANVGEEPNKIAAVILRQLAPSRQKSGGG
jgi:gluconokinase